MTGTEGENRFDGNVYIVCAIKQLFSIFLREAGYQLEQFVQVNDRSGFAGWSLPKLAVTGRQLF